MYYLEKLYQARGKADQAEALWLNLLAVGRRVMGENHGLTSPCGTGWCPCISISTGGMRRSTS